jgi:hypothetical protein
LIEVGLSLGGDGIGFGHASIELGYRLLTGQFPGAGATLKEAGGQLAKC